jgi:hypothetical protein
MKKGKIKVYKTPRDLAKKRVSYKARGIQKQWVVFEQGVPECFWTDPDKPYGRIPICDSMTEKDVLDIYYFRKKLRKEYLKSKNIRKRKYITKNETRDHEWYIRACRQGDKPDYKKLARDWAKKKTSRDELLTKILSRLWKEKSECESSMIEDAIVAAQAEEKSFNTFLDEQLATLKDSDIKADIVKYASEYLPPIIRSAVSRFKQLI